MCEFFSFITEPTYSPGQKFYFDWEYRKNNLTKDCDSHTMIAKFFGLKEDYCNKYEYNPITNEFKIDKINNYKDDSLLAEGWVRKLNIKKIVKPLVIKEIIHPLKLPKAEIGKKEIELLKEWDSVWDSVRYSVWDSVRYSVRYSVRDFVRDSVWDSVWDSVRYSVWDSVWDSVRYSVRDSVGDSVWDSVWDSVGGSVYAYISSFFIIKYDHNFSSCIKLWERGIVPSFDGTIWRLHSGEKAEVIFEISVEELKKERIMNNVSSNC